MHDLIDLHLTDLCNTHGVRLLFACETGSRGWGFASPDSDYDVRFVYAHPRDAYLGLMEPASTLERMVERGAEPPLDYSGWDLRKFLQHVRGSNAVMFEWLQSPSVYAEANGFRDALWALAQAYVAPRRVIHHYLGIARKAQDAVVDGVQIGIKKYFYVLRPLLAAIWAADYGTIPPMEFGRLLPLVDARPNVRAAIHRLLEEKARAREGQLVDLVPELQAFIAAETARCQSVANELPVARPNDEPLNRFFRDWIV